MTNYEFYKDKIMETNHGIPVVNGVPNFDGCAHTSCSDCLRDAGNNCSDAKFIGWLMSEYEDHTDWANVPVDTPILVKDTNWDRWVPRHFAKYEGGEVYAWSYGSTSYTAQDVGHMFTDEPCCTKWSMAKLTEEEQKLCSNGKPCTHPNCNRCGTTHFVSECDYEKELNE